MKNEFIPKAITLFAGAVVCIVAIVKDLDVTYSLEVLLVTLIVFYILGLLVQKIFLMVEKSNRIIQQQRDQELEEERRKAEEEANADEESLEESETSSEE